LSWRVVLIIGNKAARKRRRPAERILVAARTREQVNQRIEIPQPVLGRRRRQHQHEAKAAVGERLLKADGNVWRIGNAVEIAQLVCFVEDQHLKAVREACRDTADGMTLPGRATAASTSGHRDFR
jgi:hypothetical protein